MTATTDAVTSPAAPKAANGTRGRLGKRAGIKHEKFLFLAGVPPYVGDAAFQELVNRVESVISRENSNWSQALRDKPKEKPPDQPAPQ